MRWAVYDSQVAPDMKKLLIIMVILLLLSGAAYLAWRSFNGKGPQPHGTAVPQDPCQGVKGYSWDTIARACVKQGLSDDEKRASNIARDYLGGQLKGVIVRFVEILPCEGCFRVELTADGAEGYVILENWSMREYRYKDRSYGLSSGI